MSPARPGAQKHLLRQYMLSIKSTLSARRVSLWRITWGTGFERGAPLIYQAARLPQLGYADFLGRAEDSCPRWAWSYEPWDTKLARTARPEHVLQIALYGGIAIRLTSQATVSGRLHAVRRGYGSRRCRPKKGQEVTRQTLIRRSRRDRDCKQGHVLNLSWQWANEVDAGH